MQRFYEVPPKLLPEKANSLALVIDYPAWSFADEEQMKDNFHDDSSWAMFRHQLQASSDDSIMEDSLYTGSETHCFTQGASDRLQLEKDCCISMPISAGEKRKC